MTGAEKSKKWFLQERLLQSQKLAALGELSAGIAHEINNPLAIIRQEAEWMQHAPEKGEPGRADDLEELQGSVRRSSSRWTAAPRSSAICWTSPANGSRWSRQWTSIGSSKT